MMILLLNSTSIFLMINYHFYITYSGTTTIRPFPPLRTIINYKLSIAAALTYPMCNEAVCRYLLTTDVLRKEQNFCPIKL